MSKVTISKKYQVIIPKVERQRVGLSPGQKLTVQVTETGDIVMSQRPVLDMVAGAGTNAWHDSKITPDEYLRQLREEWNRDAVGA